MMKHLEETIYFLKLNRKEATNNELSGIYNMNYSNASKRFQYILSKNYFNYACSTGIYKELNPYVRLGHILDNSDNWLEILEHNQSYV